VSDAPWRRTLGDWLDNQQGRWRHPFRSGTGPGRRPAGGAGARPRTGPV